MLGWVTAAYTTMLMFGIRPASLEAQPAESAGKAPPDDERDASMTPEDEELLLHLVD
jgi:hypothetical protein